MTQGERVLNKLEEAKGDWINGRVFLHEMMLSQYHTRIHELQKKGHQIEASDFTDEYGFKSYRLVTRPPKVEPKYAREFISPYTSPQLGMKF